MSTCSCDTTVGFSNVLHILTLDIGAYELIVPSPFANVLLCAKVRMWTGNYEFAYEMRSPKVRGFRPEAM